MNGGQIEISSKTRREEGWAFFSVFQEEEKSSTPSIVLWVHPEGENIFPLKARKQQSRALKSPPAFSHYQQGKYKKGRKRKPPFARPSATKAVLEVSLDGWKDGCGA